MSEAYEPAILSARRRSRQEDRDETLKDGTHPLPNLLSAAPYRLHSPMTTPRQGGHAASPRRPLHVTHVHTEYTMRTASHPPSPVAGASPVPAPLTIISPVSQGSIGPSSRSHLSLQATGTNEYLLNTPSSGVGRWTGRPAGVSVAHPPLSSPYNRLSRGFTAWLSTHSPFSPPSSASASKTRFSPPSLAFPDAAALETLAEHDPSDPSNPANLPRAATPAASSSISSAAVSSSAAPAESNAKSPTEHVVHLAQRGFAAITDYIKDMQAPAVSLVHSVNSMTPSSHHSRPSSISASEPRQVISHSIVDNSSTPRSRSGAVPRRASPEGSPTKSDGHGPKITNLISVEVQPTSHIFTLNTRAHADAHSEDARLNPSAPSSRAASLPLAVSPTSVSSDGGDAANALSPSVNMHPAQSLSTWHSGTELSFFDSLASYGFRSDESPEKVEWLSKYVKRLQEQEAAWSEVQTKLDTLSERTYKMLTRDGIPAAYRARVWWFWLNPESIQSEHPEGYYASLLEVAEQQLHTETSKTILKDVDRTFTAHPFFKDPAGEGVAALRRVLLAYATRNPRVGYCQGLNFLAGFFILFYDEEEAFWMMSMIIEKFLPADYYTESMLGVQADVAVLLILLQKRLPKIWSHLQKLECISLEGVFTGWFLCLFIKTTPVETTLRILDSLFVEGTKILFRVALALMDLHSAEILACDEMGPLFHCFNTMGARTYDCDQLMKRAFDLGNIQRVWIEKERAKQLTILTAQYEEMERKRQS